MLTITYLAAIIAANLTVAQFGPSGSVLTAFLCIGLNLSARDRLHTEWSGAGLKWKMASLILGGSVLSWVLNAGAGRVALASAVAFMASEAVDAVVFTLAKRRRWMVRANTSNAVSAMVDSVVFPTLAFGAFLPVIVAGQYLAKVFGGAVWAWLLRPKGAATAAAALALLLSATPTQAQILNASVGHLIVDDYTDEVVELYAASPPVGQFRASAVLSNPVSDLSGTPTWLLQASWDPNQDIGFDVGFVDTPFDEPTMTVGAHVVRSLGPLAITILHSYQPGPSTWTTVLKLGVTWFRR